MRRHADGSVELLVPATNLDAFRSWVLGMLAARGRRRSARAFERTSSTWLHSIVDGGRPTDRAMRLVRPPRNAEERLQRLLVMLPWLMEVGEVPLADVARRFDMTEADVQKNLELVAMCGLPPFVDEMIDVFVDEGIVYVGVPRLFTRPLRLTAPEGVCPAGVGSCGDGAAGCRSGRTARARARRSSQRARRAGRPRQTGDVTAGVVFDLDRPPLTDELAEFTATGRRS